MTNSASSQGAAAPTDTHIAVRGRTMQYGNRLIQRDLNFSIRRGDVFVIMGRSGYGTSTLPKHRTGLERPAAGHILLHGERFCGATPAPPPAMRKQWGITYPQGRLCSDLTLAENVAVPLQQYTEMSDAEIRDVIAYNLALVGLAGFEEFYPNEISGG